jgi:hypothetical protein
LSAEDYDLIFDDDESGEAADVVVARVIGGIEAPTQIDVEFYHCKYSSADVPGARIEDLYVVCGQAQTSIRWMSFPENGPICSHTCCGGKPNGRVLGVRLDSSEVTADWSKYFERLATPHASS